MNKTNKGCHSAFFVDDNPCCFYDKRIRHGQFPKTNKERTYAKTHKCEAKAVESDF